VIDADDSAPLPTWTLSSDVLGGAAALRAFDEATAAVFAPRPDIVSPGDFRIDMSAQNLGSLVVAHVGSVAAQFERDRRLIASTGADHIYLMRYSLGGSEGIVEGGEFNLRTGDIGLFDLTRPRRTRSDAFRNMALVIPRAMLTARNVDVDSLHGLVLPRELPLTAMLSAHLDALELHAPRLSRRDGEIMGRATISLIAALLERHQGRSLREAMTHRGRIEVMRYINAHLGDPELTPARLVETFGMSRAALYRMFHADGGIAEVIRERRLTEAAVILGAPDAQHVRISEVARRLGFGDDTSFSRAFRTHFGIAPRDARGRAVAALGDGDADNANLGAWLRRLAR
jgi:AraC-like DNA-binding protein